MTYELVRQSQIVKSATDSFGMLVSQELTPTPFTTGLHFPLAEYGQTETLIIQNLSSAIVSCLSFHQGPKITYIYCLSRVFKFYSGVLC